MASWVSQSPSSTSFVQNSLKSSASQIAQDGLETSRVTQSSTVRKYITEFSSKQRNNGIMGVPISSLDKFYPEQFEILGATESEGKGFSGGLWHEESKVAQPLIDGKKVYKRIFIKFKEND